MTISYLSYPADLSFRSGLVIHYFPNIYEHILSVNKTIFGNPSCRLIIKSTDDRRQSLINV